MKQYNRILLDSTSNAVGDVIDHRFAANVAIDAVWTAPVAPPGDFTVVTGTRQVFKATFPALVAAGAGDYIIFPGVSNINFWALALRTVAALKDKNRVTFPALAAAADGDFVALTDADGLKWALALDTNGGGITNAGTIYATDCAGRQIVTNISGTLLAPSVAAVVVANLSVAFLAKFTVTDNLNGTVDFEAKTAGACAAAQKKDAAETGAGSITFSHTVTGTTATPEPTGPGWVAVPAANRVLVDISACTDAISVAAACEGPFNALGGEFTANDAAADGTMLFTNATRVGLSDGAVHNKNDTGAGTIIIATDVPGVAPGFTLAGLWTKMVSHGALSGQKLRVSIGAGSLPTGLLAATDYWLAKVSASDFKICLTRDLALAGTGIALTSLGTETQTITLDMQSNVGTVLVEYSPETDKKIDGMKWRTLQSIDLIGGSSPTAIRIPDNYYGFIRATQSVLAGPNPATMLVESFGKAL